MDINTILTATLKGFELVQAENKALRERVAQLEAIFKEQASAKKEDKPKKEKKSE